SSRNLFDRVRCGMPGTAMPGTPAATLDAAGTWDLVHYLRSLMPAGAQAIASTSVRTLVAAKLEGAVPESPDDPRFAAAASTWIGFAPFHDAEPSPTGAFVQGLSGDRVLAVRPSSPSPARCRASIAPCGSAARCPRARARSTTRCRGSRTPRASAAW